MNEANEKSFLGGLRNEWNEKLCVWLFVQEMKEWMEQMKNILSGEDTNEKSTFGSKMKQMKTNFLGNEGMKNTKKMKRINYHKSP